MLENSIWQQYHTEKSIRETLAAIYACDISHISSDEAELYAILKRHLTKKELRCFIMHEAGISNDEIMKTVKLDGEGLEQMLHKTYSKIKGNKISKEMRLSPKRENQSN